MLNTYSSDEINSVIGAGWIKSETFPSALINLECLDSVNCEQVLRQGFIWNHAQYIVSALRLLTQHGLSLLDGQYDTFAANIVTSEDTNRDANMSVEIYLDDVPLSVLMMLRDEHIRTY